MNIMDVINVIGTTGLYQDEQLEALEPWPEEARLSGDLRHWQKVVFSGEEIVGVIWKSFPGLLDLTGYPFDQAVFVLQGSVTLRPEQGEIQEYKAGDIFMFPKGYNGTWEMTEEYKELIVVERKAWDSQYE